MKESCNSNEIEDISFALNDLQYSSIIDIPFHTRVFHQLFSFFGKINTSFSAPAFLGYFYYIVLIFQSFLPTFLIDCEDIWPKKSFITMLLDILCYLYQGPHSSYKSYRVIMSIIVSIFFIILFIILIIRAHHYQKAGRVSSIETKFFYFTFKYIMPLLCPHIVSGVIVSFDQIIIQKRIDYNIFCIILSIITIVSYLCLFYVIICPRVLFENTPSHEWIPIFNITLILNTILLSCISEIAGLLDGKKRVACSICMLLISSFIGTMLYITNGFVKMMINVISSATYFGSAFSSLFITIIILISKKIAPEIIFVISVVVYAILIIIIKILKQMQITKILMIFDSLMESERSSEEIFIEKYNSLFKFLCDIRSVIEIWHPFISQFGIFELAISKWPDKFDILLFYSRILTIFPNKNHKMISIASMISQLPESNFRTSYLYQFRQFSRSRQTSITPIFKKKFNLIIQQTEICNTAIKKFWEEILQSNISNFWYDSENVITTVSELDSLYAQLIGEYTSNYQLLKSYAEFIQNIKHDSDEAKEVFMKLEKLRMNGVNESDLALIIALKVFPNLNNCIELYENSYSVVDETNNSINISALDDSKQNKTNDQPNVNDDNITSNENEIKQLTSDQRNENDAQENNTEFELEILFSNLTKHSKLGFIWIECIILILMTIVSIVLFYLLYDCYIKKYSKKQEKAMNFLMQINIFLNELSYFSLKLNILPLVFEDQIKTQISILNFSEFTEQISPSLYKNGFIPEFSLNTELMIELLSNVTREFTKALEYLSILDKKDKLVQEMNFVVYLMRNFTYTFNEIANNQFFIAHELLKCTTTREFFLKEMYYSQYTQNNMFIYYFIDLLLPLSHDYCSYCYRSSQDLLKEKMILVILITLLCVTLPYLIQLLILNSQSEAIAQSFLLFPKTEIRSVIDNYGESSSKCEDSQQPNIVNCGKGKNKLDHFLLILTFIASFIGVIICSLVIYFTAIDIQETAESIANEINSYISPFSSLAKAFTHGFRFYMLTHDGTTQYDCNIHYIQQNAYYSGNDNLYYILSNFQTSLFSASLIISSGMYGFDGGLNSFYSEHDKIYDYFENIFTVDTNDSAIDKTFFETLATNILTESLSHISNFLNAYYIEVNFMYQYSFYPDYYPKYLYQLGAKINEMPSLIYWFSEFAKDNREKEYIKLIENDIFNKVSKYSSTGHNCLYFVIIWQIVACICMLLYLQYRHDKIQKVLHFYNFFKPEVILQNSKVLALIESGKQFEDKSDNDVLDSEIIFSKITQGCVITHTDFKIVNCNNAFIKLFEINDDNIISKNLLDIIQGGRNKAWDQLISNAKNSLAGKNKTSFSENISFELQSGKTIYFNCIVLCITLFGIADENETSKIEKIAFVFDENIEVFFLKQKIEKERKHLTQMLSNAMPSRIIDSFLNSKKNVSFIVQTVSIGSIRVKVQKKFDENTPEEFVFYNQIFKRFDDEIASFDLLCKLKIFSHTYTFIGGLFSEINKPERHAEESIKFAMNLLNITHEMSEQFGAEIQLTIGVHTGGPVVAGVISFEKPTFQIIGTVSEIANQMKNKGIPQTVCISRSVYELIFSSGFKVQEQGDTTIKGGKIISTYLVRP